MRFAERAKRARFARIRVILTSSCQDCHRTVHQNHRQKERYMKDFPRRNKSITALFYAQCQMLKSTRKQFPQKECYRFRQAPAPRRGSISHTRKRCVCADTIERFMSLPFHRYFSGFRLPTGVGPEEAGTGAFPFCRSIAGFCGRGLPPPEEGVPIAAGGACSLVVVQMRFKKFGREGYSLRLSSTPAARSPSSAPNTGAGAWVRVGETPAAVVAAGAAVVAAA